MRISVLLFLFMGFSTLLFTGCDDDEGDGNVDLDNIAEIVTNNPDFSILLAALQEVNLDVTLADENQLFTVFAPNNAAFNAAGINEANVANVAGLEEILRYHVLGGGRVASTDLAQGQTYATTAAATGPGESQLSLLIERDNADVTLNGSTPVISADLAAENGIIHVISQVLSPPNVVDIATANSNFTALVGALGDASGDLVTVLSDPDQNYTVFAPLNSGFTAIESTVDDLDANQLSQVLLYHVVPGNIRSGQLALGAVPTANDGATFNVTSLSPIEITDANNNVIEAVGFDVQGTNGVVHVLEGVLIPEL